MPVNSLARATFLGLFPNKKRVDRRVFQTAYGGDRRDDRHRAEFEAADAGNCMPFHIFDDDFADERRAFRQHGGLPELKQIGAVPPGR